MHIPPLVGGGTPVSGKIAALALEKCPLPEPKSPRLGATSLLLNSTGETRMWLAGLFCRKCAPATLHLTDWEGCGPGDGCARTHSCSPKVCLRFHGLLGMLASHILASFLAKFWAKETGIMNDFGRFLPPFFCSSLFELSFPQN